MLKVLALFLDLLSVLFALLAPVAIVHWLLSIIGVPQLTGFIDALRVVFDPMNALIDSALGGHVPHIAYQGRDITVTQGILGFILTLVFFLLAGLATATRSMDKKLAVARDLSRSKARAEQLAAVRDVQDRKTSNATSILVEILYPFEQTAEGAARFQGFSEYGGRLVSSRPEAWVLMFNSPDDALQFVVSAAKSLRQYYATLRPMDPQPPFRIALHATEPSDTATREGVGYLHLILRYAADHQVVFSQELRDLMAIRPPKTDYDIQSIGMFDLGQAAHQEIFRLFYQPRQHHAQ
ncbi:MAG: hypothetical protein IPK79_04755 [Vampirovibrionales bacterium]|nr:hypothetical protein [Vampirovibrionales bacterium]